MNPVKAPDHSLDLESLAQTFARLSNQETRRADQPTALIACEEALEAARCGNYGVGAVLIDPEGDVIERGRNQAFRPRFHSDYHAEMVVMNAFEDHNPDAGNMRGYTLMCSLEPCPMCLCRLLIAGVETVKFAARDDWGGMATSIDRLPPAWRRLAQRQQFELADVSDELRQLATDLFMLNLDNLRQGLWQR